MSSTRVIVFRPRPHRARPTAESLAVKDGCFMAVGSRADIESLRGEGTLVFNHRDTVITPGFIDAHTHPAGAGVRELKDVNVDVRSVAEIKERHGRPRPRHAARRVDPRLQVRRHQARRRAAPQPPRPGRGRAGPPGGSRPPGRPHQRLQFACVRARGGDRRDPRPRGRQVLPRRRRTHRPRGRARQLRHLETGPQRPHRRRTGRPASNSSPS